MEYYCSVRLEDGLYVVDFPDLTSVITAGDSLEEALFMAEEALNAALATDITRGFPLPDQKTSPAERLYPISVAPHIVVAARIRELGGDKSQTEIAHRLGIPYQSYQRIENPVKGNPTLKTLEVRFA